MQTPIKGRFDTGLYGFGASGIDNARARRAFLVNKPGILTPEEQAESDRLGNYIAGVPDSKSSGSLGDMFDGQGKLLDKANDFTEKQMALSFKYRGLEGAYQKDIDEQANRRIITDGGQKIDLQRVADDGADKRIKTDGDVKISLQNNQGDVNERAKQNDARRALVNFRSDGKGAG